MVELIEGYDYVAEHIELRYPVPAPGQSAKDLGPPQIIRKQVPVKIPPKLGAICLVLFNKDPEHWKDKREIKHTGQIGHTGVLMTETPLENTEEWDKYVEKLKLQGVPDEANDPRETSLRKSSGRRNRAASKPS